MVHGGAGTVGRYAIQMARLKGARVLTTVSSEEKARHAGADGWVNYRDGNAAAQLRQLNGGADFDLIVDVDFGQNQAVNLELIAESGCISTFASVGDMEPVLQFYPFMFKNVTLKMLIAYLIPASARRQGEAEISDWLRQGKLSHAVVDSGNLTDVAAAHDLVASGNKLGTVVLNV